MTEVEAADGFYTGTDAVGICGTQIQADGKTEEQLGFCLPSYKTKTQITFGGRSDFLHIGDFIQFMYRYGIWVVGLLAILMIVFAGFERLTSGGNPDRIQSSNKRIGGALVGVLLAVGSFVILRTINPALVNLRLPQVWMVNPIRLSSPFCSGLPDNTVLAPLGPTGQPTSEAQKKAAYTSAQQSKAFQPMTIAPPKCGTDYLVQSGGNQTCSGTICEPTGSSINSCFIFSGNSSCKKGNIVGAIYNSSAFSDNIIADVVTEEWDWPWSVGDIELQANCLDGSDPKLSTTQATVLNKEKKIQFFALSVSELALNGACGSITNLKGFYLDVTFNEALDLTGNEDHFIGKGPNGTGIDLGDFEAFGKDAYDKTRYTAPKEFFFQIEDIQKGILVNIDAGKVCDIDNSNEEKTRKECYGKLGYE